ncbi:MAG: hypothetical protein ACXW4N_11715, partial [Candidatus Deferrimicrobiaceae bacterium]
MRVVYSIPTRIGASGLGANSFEALKGIYARGYLERVVAYGNRQKEILVCPEDGKPLDLLD